MVCQAAAILLLQDDDLQDTVCAVWLSAAILLQPCLLTEEDSQSCQQTWLHVLLLVPHLAACCFGSIGAACTKTHWSILSCKNPIPIYK
jgi:hypothetical protein